MDNGTAIMTQTPIHAGDRVVIVHGPDAKRHRGKVWVVETAPDPCPGCETIVTLKGYSGSIPAAYVARIRDDAYPERYR